MESTFEFLRFVQSKDLSFWDVKRLSFSLSNLSKTYSSVKLGDILTPIKNKIKKNEYNGQLPIISKISFNDGKIHLRDDFKTGMDLYSLSLNDLLISNINFHQGATAINKIGDVVCSTHYQPYSIDFFKVIPEYLILVLRNKIFLEYVSQQKTNGIKTESNYNFIKNLEIPLPSMEKQKELVAHYNALLNLAKDKENQAEQMEQSIDDYLIAELGIKDNLISTNKNLFQTVEYKNLSKWVLDASYSISSKYKIFSFDEVCSKITDGTHQTPEYVSQGITFLSAKDVTSQELSLKNVKYIPEYLHNQLKARCLPQKDDILLAKNGTTGVAALFTLDYEVSIYVSLALLRCNLQLILPKFLLYYINSKFAKEQFDKGLIGVGVPNLHLSVIKNTLIPLPPLDVQNQIVEEITLRKEQIKNLREESEKLRLQAISNFEKEVFN